MHSLSWYAGFFVGMLIALGFFIVMRTLLGRRKREYDERQKLAQGHAYAGAFWALLIFLALVSLAQILFEAGWFDPFTLSITGIVFGVTVYAVICIGNDAYLPLRETPARFYLTGLLVIAANLLAMVGNLPQTPLMEDGKLTTTSMSLLVAAMYAFILLVYAGKQWRDRRTADDPDDGEE